ncbi:uncharacterized protein RHOBADRAFT_52339 [Rhodotorula graminis WP1]|uniref:Hydrogen voltage-gated channel 1 n=1 Tax=Rhodotorula graminis (strain WP1) TaxID=578459 RepID=A0A194S6Z1_RHOGW|nr:uncharacterized protein RHOBADRAFT_52339 [Rhodotorula graminis WP1]KPV76314.1 hypothetical protein RHOBADRAFT_52339 [Rhodotorula graminis WP1]
MAVARTTRSSDSDSDVDDADGAEGDRPAASGVQLVRQRLRKFLSAPRTEASIIGLSMVDFALCFTQVAWLILRDQMCECRGSCEEEEPRFLAVVNVVSLCITGAFVLEIPLDAAAFGHTYYTSARYHWLHVIDSLIILTAFILEVVLQSIAGQLASLMTVLRLWRVVKLVSTAEIGLVDYNELTMHEEERRLWRREQERTRGVVDGLRHRLSRSETH